MDLLSLAHRQHGVISRAQAIDAGFTAGQVRWRLERGRWSVVHPGVYAVPGHARLTWEGRAWAALLHAGPGAALALDSAAYLWGWREKPPAVIALAVPHERRVRRVPGTRVVRRRGLRTTLRRGLSVTTPAQTVIDIGDAFEASRQDAVSIAARAVQSRLVEVPQLAAELSRRAGHRHRRAVSLALGVVARGAESGLEVSFHEDVLRAHGLPPMQLQAPATIDGGSIRRDFRQARYGVVVEVDGRVGHGPAEQDRDRLRDRRTTRSGGITLRAGWADVEFDPCALALDVFGTLAARGYLGSIRPCGRSCAVSRLELRPG
jgi:very-short-patch-repair endonuclease